MSTTNIKSEHISYQYCKERIEQFTELYQYMLANWKHLPINPYIACEKCPVHIKHSYFEDGEHEYTYYYNSTEFLRTYHDTNISYEDESFSHYNSTEDFTLGCAKDNTTSFTMVYTSNRGGGELHELLTPEELTEEMYNQMTFVCNEEVVFCMFLISHLLSLGIDGVYKMNKDINPKNILNDLKEFIDAKLDS